jgi:Holliday junction resolvase
MAEEATIQQEILDYLHRTGWMAWNNDTDGLFMKGRRVKNKKKGSPDIEAVKNGVYLACEVKGPKAKLQEDQLAWLQDVARHGGVSIVVGSLKDAVLAVTQKTGERGASEDIWIGKDIKFASLALERSLGKPRL